MEKWLGFPTINNYNGLDLNDLPLNYAYVVSNTTIDHVGVYSVPDDCYNCPYRLQRHFGIGEDVSWMVDTTISTSWRILRTQNATYELPRNIKSGWLCQMRPKFHEYGVYRLEVGRCNIATEVAPVNTYLPLLLSSLIILGAFLIYGLIKCLWKKKTATNKQQKTFQINSDEEITKPRTIDIFRDLLVYLLVFTNSGGGGYPLFKNTWGGLNLSDCLYFAYVWTIGVNIPTVIDKASEKQSKLYIMADIFKRSFVLFLLGVAMDSAVYMPPALWWPLQRLAVAYFVVGTAYVLTVHKFEIKSKRMICKAMGNLVSLVWCWILTALLLAVFITSMSVFLSFNCLRGVSLEKGADHPEVHSQVTLDCENQTTEFANIIFVSQIQRMIDVNAYIGYSRGVMGLLSTVMCTLIGLKAGIVYLHYRSHLDRLNLWAFWATLFGVGGVIFAVISYPLNFNLWPISSILVITTVTLHLFAFVYLITEVWTFTSSCLPSGPSPSLLVLIGNLLFSHSYPFNWQIRFHSHIIFLLQSYWTVFLWVIIGSMFKRKINIQI